MMKQTGTLTLGGLADPANPSNYVSTPFTVTHPSLAQSALGWMAVGKQAAAYPAPVGVLVAFFGEAGTNYWSNSNHETWQMGESLRSQGWLVVQVKWKQCWWAAKRDEDAGIATLAARPATVVAHVHQTYCADIPLVLAGNSGGGGQAAYCLTHYGLASIVAKAVLSGGPPFCALRKSCDGAHSAYQFNLAKRQAVDKAHGWWTTGGPAQLKKASALYKSGKVAGARWDEDSIVSAESNYVYPSTKVSFIIGSGDPAMQAVASDYYNVIKSISGNQVTWQIIPNTLHQVYGTAAGRAAILNAILS